MNHGPHSANPFPGLRPFTQEEDYLFFGREEQTLELLSRLGRYRFIGVVGRSGSGKSSLVRCGLLSELLGGKMLGAGASWEIAVTHPGGNPLALLTEALLEADLYDREQENTRENLLVTLSRSHFGQVEAVKQAGLGEDTNFLLVVDQFEEIFRFHEAGQTQQEMANEFVSLLLEAAAQKEVPIYVVLTMRSDFIGECGQYEGLAEAVNRGEFLIPGLTRQQYKRVIEGPIKVAGGAIAPRLLQRLLNDLGQHADQLPCLQHALMRTWNVWAEKGDAEALDLEDYHHVGRMSEALSLHADEVFNSLASDRQRALCAGVFKALTVQESDNRGIRRPQRLGRLCQILDASVDELLPIIDAYRAPGVTFLMPSHDVELTDRTIIDISHESLMRVWTRLRHWVDEEAQAAGIYLRLSESAALYGQGKAGLYRDPELGIALAWQESNRPNAAWAERYRSGFAAAIGFLEASQRASLAEEQAREAARQRELEQAQQLAETQARATRLFKRFTGGLAAGLCLAMALTVWAFLLRDEAKRQEATANEQRLIAQVKEREAGHQSTLAQSAEQEMKRIAAQADAAKDNAQRENYRSTIKLAESMLQGDVQAQYRVADVLWTAQPELRGWEWGHLMARCPLEEWSLPTNQDGLNALAASADGRFLATAGGDGTIALWDSWTCKELWRRKAGRVLTLEIDPRNRYVGAGSSEESQPVFQILDIATGQTVHEAAETGSAHIAFSASGDDLYVFRMGELARIGTDTWTQLVSAPGPRPRLLARMKLFVDAAGAYIGVHDLHNSNQEFLPNNLRSALYDPETLRPVADLDAIIPTFRSHLSSMTKPVFDSELAEFEYTDGPRLFRNSLAPDGSIRLDEDPQLEHPAVIDYFVHDARSETTIVASGDGTVTVHDSDGQLRTLSHGLPIRGLVLLPDGRFVTGGADGVLKCWKPSESARLAYNTAASPSPASDGILAFASTGDPLLYRTWARDAFFLFDMGDLTFRGFARPVISGRFPMIQPGTNDLVIDSETGLSFYRCSDNGTSLDQTRSLEIAQPFAAAFDASGRILVVANRGQEPAVFDVSSNQRLPVPEARGIGEVSVNPAGTRAALVTAVNLQVWDVASGRLLNRLDWDASSFGPTDEKRERYNPEGTLVNVKAPAFHPNGDLLALIQETEDSSALVVWDSALGKLQRSIPGVPGRRIASCVFSPDGNRLLTPCSDGKMRIWDWRIGKELFALSDLAQTANVAASADGVTIAYSGWAPSLRIAKALPWNQSTLRDGDFYRAVDDLWIYTAQRDLFAKGQTLMFEHWSGGGIRDEEETGKWVRNQLSITSADEAETLGDIARRRGQGAESIGHYTEAIANRQSLVLAQPDKAQLQYRLAAVFEKRLAVEAAGDSANREAVLKQAVEFWQQLASRDEPHPLAWRYLVDFQSRHSGAVGMTMAAVWQGTDQPLNDAAQTELRRRTRDALQAELSDWEKILEKGPSFARPVVARTLNHWQRDSALSSIRDAADLAKLPAEDQQSFAQLWANVGMLQNKVEEPGNSADRLRFARRAYDRRQFAAATDFFTEALTNDPTAGDDPWKQHRYLAACAAALLAAGQAEDQPPLDEVAKAKLRVQAVDWLRADLAAWNKLIESSPPDKGAEIAQYLSHWQQDSDLAGIRDATALAELPEDEREACVQLWANVAKSLQAANAKLAALVQEALPGIRQQLPAESPQLAGVLAQISLGLLEVNLWDEAEPLLRECLAIREKTEPDSWSTFNTQSMLGGVLLGQNKYADAESLLLAGYAGMKQREETIPDQGRPRLSESLDRLIELYTATDKPDEVKKWQAEREKYRVVAPPPPEQQ